MGTLYRIRDWEKHFENNRTRELKSLAWVPLPNKHDGDGYTELLDHDNGPSHYGAWVALVQVASRCDPRGTLLRDCKKPHSAGTLSRMTRFHKPVMEEAMARLIQIGWLEALPYEDTEDTEIPQQGAAIPQDTAVKPQQGALKGMEWKEGNGREEKPKGRAVIDESAIDFPDELNTAGVRAATMEWIEHHRKIGKPYRDASSIVKLLKQWVRAGPAAFVAAVDHSIGNNYQGVVPVKELANASRNGPGQQFERTDSQGKGKF